MKSVRLWQPWAEPPKRNETKSVGSDGSGGLLLRRGLFDDAHDVGLLHDEEILAIDAHLGARPLAKQDAVAGLEIQRGHLAALIASARPDGDHLALLGFLLGRIRDDNPALGLLFRVDAADHNTVVKRTKLHKLLHREFLIVEAKGSAGGSAP